VRAVYWPGEARVASSLAGLADAPRTWPGLGVVPADSITLILAANEARFDSLTGHSVPEWSVAVAYPAVRTIVVWLKDDYAQALRHELAHLALHSVVARAPRWFDEGYAAWASGEWGRADVLRVNWQLARGAPPTFEQLNQDLEAGATRAEAAYAMAATVVQMLYRIGGERGLETFVSALQRTLNFDTALREAYLVTTDQLEALWQKDLKSRYGWLSFLTSTTVLWGWMAVLLFWAWWWRRRRDRGRREALDEGWEIPPEDMPPSA
jgi:hypothetical protein